MERGDRSIAIAVLSVISIVGVLAIVTLFLREPTAGIVQGQSMYVTQDANSLGITCKNPSQEVVFLGYQGKYAVYCCLEKMIGLNKCVEPHRLITTI